MRERILELLRSVNRPGMDTLIKWLGDNDYFEAPASAEFHLNHVGGLMEHSLSVFNVLEGIAKKYAPAVPRDSIILVALLHDICKCNLYIREKRNKKIDGRWHEVEVWGHNEEVPLGHGEKSISLIQDHIKLTLDEKYSIRWHMSSWGAETYNDKKSLNAAMNKSRLLKCMILADQISTWLVEEDK